MKKPSSGLLGLVLAGMTLLPYGGVLGNDFVILDDFQYVTENPQVKKGLGFATFSWSWTTFEAGNWHPLTWLSLQLDSQCFGVESAWAIHLANLIWHLGTVILLFQVFLGLTGEAWPSFLAGALFAVHPLHVESVAWAAERKDVLSGFFWLLSMACYVFYSQKPGLPRYALLLILFALGLTAKAMLVTLPAVLLLLDFWPLGRFSSVRNAGHKAPGDQKRLIPSAPPSASLSLLLAEKIPLLAISLGSAIVTFVAQVQGEAVSTMEEKSWHLRLANAAIAYVWYLQKTLVPLDLGVMYPWQARSLFSLEAILNLAILICLSVLFWALRKKSPALLTGWLWFLGTLVPVIGLVQVGSQAMADRYTYIPHMGLFLAMVWGLSDLARMRNFSLPLCRFFLGIYLAFLVFLSWVQVWHWKNTLTLYTQTLQVTEKNFFIHHGLGQYYFQHGYLEKAQFHFDKSFEFEANFLPNLLLRGILYHRLALLSRENGKRELAEEQRKLAEQQLQRVLDLAPSRADLHHSVGLVFLDMERWQQAVTSLNRAVELKPEDPRYHADLNKAQEKIRSLQK